MPDLTSNAATFRAGRFRYSGYISTIPQTVIFSRAVNMATITYPCTAITFDDPYSGVGAFGDVQVDMTVIVYDQNTSTVKGRLRVAAGASSSTVLQVSEFARGLVDLANNDKFEVVREWRIWDKLVSATAALNKDSRTAYTDQGSNPNPVCNSGGPGVGFISGASLSLNFYGSTSFTVDPDSAGTGTHAWSFGDGTPTSSTDANPAGVTFPAGFRWISHTFTDSTNSKSTTQRIPVWAHERTGSNAPLSVQLDGQSYSNGYRTLRFRLPKEAQSDLDTLPDGAYICYWEEESYNGSNGSYGSNVTNRSHVKFVGFLLRDTITIDADRNEVTFEAVAPLGILEMTPALPQLVLSKASPANWQQVKTLTVNRILWYLIYWHTSFNTICDFLWVDGASLNYARIAIDNIDSIAGQLRDVAESINVKVTCDRLGRVLLIRDPNYLSASDRNSRTTTYNLTTADVVSLDITREHRGLVKFVRGEGITASTTTASMLPVFSNAPGNAPAWVGTGTEVLSKQIVSTQTDLNNRAGWHFARLNGMNDGLFVPKDVRLVLRGAYDWLEPAYLEWLTLTLADTTNKRGVSYSTGTRWIVEGLDITYDPDTGVKEISATISHETDAIAGTTYVPPAANNLPSFTGLDVNFDFGDFLLPANTLIKGIGNIAAFDSAGTLWLTQDFGTPEASGGPTWVSVDLTGLANWAGSSLECFAQDAFATANGVIASDTRLIKINSIGLTPTLASIGNFRGTSQRRSMNSERAQQGRIVCVSWYGTDGVWAEYSLNNTTLETPVQINANYDTGTSLFWYPGVAVIPANPGKVYTSAFTNTSNGLTLTTEGYESDDYGATWAQAAAPAIEPLMGLAGVIVVPFGNAGTTIYHAYTDDAGASSELRRVKSGVTNISPSSGGNEYGPFGLLRAVAISDANKNFLVMCGFNSTNGAVFYTMNAETATPTWTELVAPAAGYTWLQAYVADPEIYLIGSGIAIGRVGSAVLDDRTGNMSLGGATIQSICGWTP